MARLVFVTGKRISEDVVVKDGMVVGRHKDCRLTIGDEKASRKHARIVKEGGRYFIVDLKSSNGTFLNEMRVKKSALNYGDRIRSGSTARAGRRAGSPAAVRRLIPDYSPKKKEAKGAKNRKAM